MRVIAHRGNLNGISPRENDPQVIRQVLDHGLSVEVDLWEIEGRHFFGHDSPAYLVNLAEFDVQEVYFHLKTPHVPRLLHADAFAIDNDRYSLTLRGWLWTNYGQPVSAQSIMCAPELVGHREPLDGFVSRCRDAAAICTDFPHRVSQLLENWEVMHG